MIELEQATTNTTTDTVVVVGDIHGNLHAFETILEKIHHRFGNRVFIVLVGDLVDRGPDSAGVVRRVRTAVEGGTMECVLGNHDDMFLQLLLLYRPRLCKDAGIDATVQEKLVTYVPDEPARLLRLWLCQGGTETIDSYGGIPSLPETWDIPPEDISFLSNRPLAWRRGAITVTHARGDVAAIQNALAHPLDPWNVSETDRMSVLWDREPIPSVEDGIHVCGHTPRDAPLEDGLTREIDTGCAYHRTLTAYAPDDGLYLSASCSPYFFKVTRRPR